MKKKSRIISFLLAFILMFSIFPYEHCFAQTPVNVEPCFVHLSSIGSNISISATGVATCTGVAIDGYTNDSLSLKVELQRKVNGNWSTITTWASSGSLRVTISKTCNVLSGYDYRTLSTASVYSSSGSLIERVSNPSATTHY